MHTTICGAGVTKRRVHHLPLGIAAIMRVVGLFEPVNRGIIQRARPCGTLQAARPSAAKRNGLRTLVDFATGKAKVEQQGWRVARELEAHEAPPGAVLTVVERLRKLSRERGLIV
jgi:hypothetical protein